MKTSTLALVVAALLYFVYVVVTFSLIVVHGMILPWWMDLVTAAIGFAFGLSYAISLKKERKQ